MSEQWLSIVEYARTFSVSDMTIRRRIKNGRLKAVLKDGKYYIPLHPSQSKLSAIQGEKIDKSVGSSRTIGAEYKSNGHEISVKSREGNSEFYKNHAYLDDEDPSVWKNESLNTPHSMKEFSSPRSYGSPTQVGQSVVESRQLLEFCEKALNQSERAIKDVSQKYENRILALESITQKKDMEIKELRQQVEDLQVLVKIFERKS